MIIPSTTDTTTTADVCFTRSCFVGQMIFLNSAFRPSNQLFLGVDSEFPITPHFLCPKRRLLGFLVYCMSLAETTVLLSFHSVRMSFLILCHVVVTLFTFCTCQCNSSTHNFHLALLNLVYVLRPAYLPHFLGIKKKPASIRPHSITQKIPESQVFLSAFSL